MRSMSIAQSQVGAWSIHVDALKHGLKPRVKAAQYVAKAKSEGNHELSLYNLIVKTNLQPLSTFIILSVSTIYQITFAHQTECVSTTSVPSERVFSSAGNIVNKMKRSHLSAEHVNMVIFMNKN